MLRQFKIPLFYLVIASAVGLLLRWSLVSPVEAFAYGYWVHAHSHVMFLGWVFNFLNIAFLYNAFGDQWRRPYRTLFILNQFLIVGMLVFFPMQGYGAITIPLSIAHTVVSAVFCIRFIRDTRGQKSSLTRRLAVWSLVLFLISSLGPFALGPIVAQGLGHSKWYFFAIYFYLHFQYNGVFIFGLLSLLSRWCEDNGLDTILEPLRRASGMLFVACFPTYALSLLWADVPVLFNWIGFFGAALQLAAVVVLWRGFARSSMPRISRTGTVLVFVTVMSFMLKIVLQTLSAFPVIAALAYEHKYYVIAYLHLVLIGVVTSSMLLWYAEYKLVRIGRVPIFFFVSGFVLSELIMILIPSGFFPHYSLEALFGVSVFMFIGFAGTLVNVRSSFKVSTTKARM